MEEHNEPIVVIMALVLSSVFVKLMHDKKTGAELAGGWTTEIGNQDEAGMLPVLS